MNVHGGGGPGSKDEFVGGAADTRDSAGRRDTCGVGPVMTIFSSANGSLGPLAVCNGAGSVAGHSPACTAAAPTAEPDVSLPPQPLQNLAPLRFSAPQAGHSTGITNLSKYL